MATEIRLVNGKVVCMEDSSVPVYLCRLASYRPTFLFFFLKILFIHKGHRERGRDISRGRSRLPVGSLRRDLIPGSRDHNLSLRQTLNH